MDDYKRELLMRVRDELLDPNVYHDSICFSLRNELQIDGYLRLPSMDFIRQLFPEMQELFDGKSWYQNKTSCNNDGKAFWWLPFYWTEPRIAMIDFLLNNR